jgi:hypothetical protein
MGGVLVALVEILSSIEKICGSLVETLGFNHAPDTMKTNKRNENQKNERNLFLNVIFLQCYNDYI